MLRKKLVLLIALITIAAVSGCGTAASIASVNAGTASEIRYDYTNGESSIVLGDTDSDYIENLSQTEIDAVSYNVTKFDGFEDAENKLSKHFIDFGLNSEINLLHIFNCDILQSNNAVVKFDNNLGEGGIVGTTIEVTEEQYEEIKKGNTPIGDSDLFYLNMQTVLLNGTSNDYDYALSKLNNDKLNDVDSISYYSEKIGAEVTLYYGKSENGTTIDNISLATFSSDNMVYILSFSNNMPTDIVTFGDYVKTII